MFSTFAQTRSSSRMRALYFQARRLTANIRSSARTSSADVPYSSDRGTLPRPSLISSRVPIPSSSLSPLRTLKFVNMTSQSVSLSLVHAPGQISDFNPQLPPWTPYPHLQPRGPVHLPAAQLLSGHRHKPQTYFTLHSLRRSHPRLPEALSSTDSAYSLRRKKNRLSTLPLSGIPVLRNSISGQLTFGYPSSRRTFSILSASRNGQSTPPPPYHPMHQHPSVSTSVDSDPANIWFARVSDGTGDRDRGETTERPPFSSYAPPCCHPHGSLPRSRTIRNGQGSSALLSEAAKTFRCPPRFTRAKGNTSLVPLHPGELPYDVIARMEDGRVAEVSSGSALRIDRLPYHSPLEERIEQVQHVLRRFNIRRFAIALSLLLASASDSKRTVLNVPPENARLGMLLELTLLLFPSSKPCPTLHLHSRIT
jgi:hypothetical protein